MPEGPRYAILGRGRWSVVVQRALEGEGRRVEIVAGTRRALSETDDAHFSQMRSSLAATGADIAWLCVPPGPHLPAVILAALDAGLDVIAESPWLCAPEITQELQFAAAAKNRLVGVHFEYCQLEEVESWRGQFHGAHGMTFGGRFSLSRANRHGIPPVADLGCHLAAIRQYAAHESALGEIHCEYASTNSRMVWLDQAATRLSLIDFTSNRQPIIQRFFRKFEAARATRDFPFGLPFAAAVSSQIARLLP